MRTVTSWRTGIFWLIGLVMFVLTLDAPPTLAADVCLPGEEEEEYPTQQPLFFQLEATSKNNEESREVKARLTGSGKPPTTLRVYRTIEEKLESRLIATVVPLIQQDATTLEITVSLDVSKWVLDKFPADPDLKALAARVEEALRAWRMTLSREQKEQIQSVGTVELLVDLGPGALAGVTAAGPKRVTFVSIIKRPIDLYDIGKNLEQRQAQYNRLVARYRNLEGNRLEEGLARLNIFDKGLNLFDADLTASFERLAELQTDISQRKVALARLEDELKVFREEYSATQAAPAPTLYVDVDNKRTSPDPASGFRLLEDALRRVEMAYQALFEMLKNQPDDKTTERLYRESEAKFDWLKATAKKHQTEAGTARAERLTELSQKMTALEEQIIPLKAELRTLGAEREGLSRRVRAYYDKLRAEFDTDTRNPAPKLNASSLEQDDEETLLEALDWVENIRAFQNSEREKLDQELGALIAQLTSIDTQLAVLARDVMERQQQAGCWVVRALQKADNPDLIGVLGEFNTLVGELKSASGAAAERAERLAFAQKIMTDSKVGLLGEFAKKIKVLSDAAGKVTSWAGPVQDLLKLNQQLENNDPMFFVGVLEASGNIASKVPVIGSTIKLFLDYNAQATKAILARGQIIHGEIAQRALDLLSGRGPEVHLYTNREVRDILETRLQNISDKEVAEATTEFQIRRIMHLLRSGQG